MTSTPAPHPPDLDRVVGLLHGASRRWNAARETGRHEEHLVLADLLAAGPRPGGSSLTEEPEDARPEDTERQHAFAAAALRAAGLFDEEFYATSNPDVVLTGDDLLDHFVRVGWRELRSPRADFDLWWYWQEHLDPTTETINPLLHHLLVGRAAGLPTAPTPRPERDPHRWSEDRPVRRACLFAAFDIDDVVDDYVVDYVRELSRFADVYYLADGQMPEDQLTRLAPFTRGAWSVNHGAYDFGSFALLARDLVGWDVLAGYDELLFANDSCYLLRPLDEVFGAMDAEPCDWWGLQLSCLAFLDGDPPVAPRPPGDLDRRETLRRQLSMREHISSYFMAFRRPVLDNPAFRQFFDAVAVEQNKSLVVLKYEIGLSSLLMTEGHRSATFVGALHPFHPLYNQHYFTLLEHGFPLLKRNLVSENPLDVPQVAAWREHLAAYSSPERLDRAERNLERVAADDRLRRSLAVTTDEDGTVVVPRLLTDAEVRARDPLVPTFDHWWAFPVCPLTHALHADARAVLEEVRDDPTVKKIVLTRSRRLDLGSATDLVQVPLLSREGQHHLLRSGRVFVSHGGPADVPYPLSDELHRHIGLGLDALRPRPDVEAAALPRLHAFAAVGWAPEDGAETEPDGRDAGPWTDEAPSRDLLLRASVDLPADLRSAEAQLRSAVGERHLLAVLVDARLPGTDGALLGDDLAWLATWADEHQVVLGLREEAGPGSTAWRRALAPLRPIDLSPRRHPDESVVHRVASAVLGDHAGGLSSFAATGRSVLRLVSPAGAAAHDARPDVLVAGVAVGTGGELRVALDAAAASGWVGRPDLVAASDDAARHLVSTLRRAPVRPPLGAVPVPPAVLPAAATPTPRTRRRRAVVRPDLR